VLLLEQIANGLLVGSYYIVLSLGLSLIFSLGGVVNLAHGAFYAVGAYLAYEIERRFGFFGAMGLSPVGVALIGILIERFALRRLYNRDPMLGLLFTFGLALTAEQSLRMIWGTTGLPFSLPDQLRGQLILGDFIYSYYRLFVLAVAITAVTGCWLLLNKTAFGMVLRAGFAIQRWCARSASRCGRPSRQCSHWEWHSPAWRAFSRPPSQACNRRWEPKSSPRLSSWW